MAAMCASDIDTKSKGERERRDVVGLWSVSTRTLRSQVYSAGEEWHISNIRLHIRVVKDVAVPIQASQA